MTFPKIVTELFGTVFIKAVAMLTPVNDFRQTEPRSVWVLAVKSTPLETSPVEVSTVENSLRN